MIADIIFGVCAVSFVVFVIIRKIKAYRRHGASALCSGDCRSCGGICGKNKI